MLSRAYRLPSTTKLVHPRFVKTSLFSMKYAPNDVGVSRFAFVVRKTTDKRAVVRNRIKRVFRSCIEELLEKVLSGYDMLFFLEKGIIDKQQADLCQELQKILEQQKLLP